MSGTWNVPLGEMGEGEASNAAVLMMTEQALVKHDNCLRCACQSL